MNHGMTLHGLTADDVLKIADGGMMLGGTRLQDWMLDASFVPLDRYKLTVAATSNDNKILLHLGLAAPNVNYCMDVWQYIHRLDSREQAEVSIKNACQIFMGRFLQQAIGLMDCSETLRDLPDEVKA